MLRIVKTLISSPKEFLRCESVFKSDLHLKPIPAHFTTKKSSSRLDKIPFRLYIIIFLLVIKIQTENQIIFPALSE